jgi:phosphoribosylformylglycinamidine synthase subunit PurQ / glutaminase
MKPRTLILRTAGTNCDHETAHAFEMAGAQACRVHVNRFLRDGCRLDDYQMLAIPGGFSYGDDIAAGKILANQLEHHLRDQMRDFVASGRPIIGICNGFQVLVKTELLPGPLADVTGQTCTLTNNVCGRFVDRWIKLLPQKSRCIWTKDLPVIELPIAHGEGRFLPTNEAVRNALWENQQVALVYADESGQAAAGNFPANPNGSVDDIAGVCDASGLVFGLMPHPERFVDATQHPAWTSRPQQSGEGLQVFQNAVSYVKDAVGAGI